MTHPAPISVIIPAYNAERFIAQTLESVYDQTLPVAEVIVIDDGSFDQTVQIARASRARVISQKNRGLSAARNVGINAATQPWVALLDADDVWAQSKIEHQWDAVGRCPAAGIVSCGYYYIGGSGEHLDPPRADCRERAKYSSTHGTHVGPSTTSFARDFGNLPSSFLPIPSTVLVRREAFLSSEMFDERLRRCEDVEYFLRLLARHVLLVVDRPLVGYRRHDGSLSNDKMLMRLAVEDVLRVMNSRPADYAVGALEAVCKWVRQSRVELGREMMEGARSAQARELFLQALEKEFTRRTAMLLAFTYCPPAVFKYFLNLKWALVRKRVINEALELCPLWRPEIDLAAAPD